MEKKNKIHIAFDIGVTSVGWCVVDDDGKILDYKNRWWYGVRLFDDASDEKGKPKNISRRAARQLRRIIRRRHLRNETFIKSLIQNGYVKDEKEFYEIIHNSKDMPVNLKVKGLKQELTKEEWICALFNYLQHRGFFYDVHEDNDPNSNNKDKIAIINEEEYTNKLKTEYPSVIQQEYWNNKGYYISSSFNSLISNKAWWEEIKVFLSNQKINDNVKNKFKELFTTIRDFSKGPGKGSKYGLWEFDPETQGYTKKDKENKTLWDKTIGKCSIYPDENRSIKKSGSAELFNFLNDLQNTRKFSDPTWRISQKEKEKVLSVVIKEKPTLTRIAKALDINKDDIKWPRKDTKNKEVFEELNNIRTYYSIVKPSNFEPWLHPEQLDKINTLVELKYKIKKLDKLQEEIKNVIPEFSSTQIDEIIKQIKKEKLAFHSFSTKALNKFIIDLFKDEAGMEQMQLSIPMLEKQNVNQNYFINVGKYIKLNKNKFWNLPISPSSKRAISQTFKVFNKLVKFLEKEYEIDTVTIEMAREHNSKEERETIKKLQDINKERKDQVDEKLKEDLTEEFIREKIKDSLRYKLYLYYSQEKCDIYTQKQIDIKDLINHPEEYNIDHIIPYSLSYNNSGANKVLTTRSNNSDKGNKTPYQWFSQKCELDTYNSLKGWWKELFKDKKYSNLIYEGDPAEDYNEFASRALNDTRTSTKFVADCFNQYFNKKYKESNSNNHVLYINGLITNYLRKYTSKYFGEKNRDLYRHHADDAFLLAYISTNPKMLKVFRFLEKAKIDPSKEEGKQIIDENKFDLGEFKREFNQKFNDENIFKNNMPSFSRQLNNKRTSVQFFNETLYSGLEEGEKLYKIQKIKLNKLSDKKIDEYFPLNGSKPDVILMENNIYELLWKICHDDEYKCDENGKKVNPFVQYMKKINDKFPNLANNKNLIILDRENKYIINSIKIKDKEVNKYFENKKIQKSNKNKIGFYDAMNWNSIYVYKNNGKYKIKTTNIGNKFGENLDKPDFKLYKGNIVLLKGTNHLFYIVGANDSGNNLELKPLMSNKEAYTKYYNNNLILKDKQQYWVGINKFIDNFEKVEVDELGNIYKNKE